MGTLSEDTSSQHEVLELQFFHSNLGRFVHSAVVSEVLLFGLHVIYSLLLGSVLQPGDRSTDPLQQLDRKRN